MIEKIKASLIQLADKLNVWRDPFPAFDRPPMPKEDKPLHDLENDFFSDLMENFWICGGKVLVHRIPLPEGSGQVDMGDQATWHGIFSGMLAMRYQFCKPDEVPKAQEVLLNALKGLWLHQHAHHEIFPRLIRGVSNDETAWQDDASNDTATGHLFGIYAIWKWAPEALRPMCANLAKGLGEEILTHGHSLVKEDGTPTTYGALEQGWKTDPLRLTLALAIYSVAFTLTRDVKFMKAFNDLYVKYEAIVGFPKVKLWWVDRPQDTHRAAIHLAILADTTKGDVFVSGLNRIREMVAKEGNIWVNALCEWGTGTLQDDRAVALKVLSEFTLKDKQYNFGKDNANFKASWFKRILWNGVWMANQPLPRWMTRPQDFVWQRNLRSLDPGSDGAGADSRLNGGDWLCAYWLSRITHTLNEYD